MNLDYLPGMYLNAPKAGSTRTRQEVVVPKSPNHYYLYIGARERYLLFVRVIVVKKKGKGWIR